MKHALSKEIHPSNDVPYVHARCTCGASAGGRGVSWVDQWWEDHLGLQAKCNAVVKAAMAFVEDDTSTRNRARLTVACANLKEIEL